ncbi:MAG: hypothetical protein KKG33_01780 [candidate division Zixibacteria bacterium]|nr:hypothetical protein [candidate division Zixibacteria bacterium]MBU2624269.1 hypothetical protein [candidate division Zixibacteria bacterium]
MSEKQLKAILRKFLRGVAKVPEESSAAAGPRYPTYESIIPVDLLTEKMKKLDHTWLCLEGDTCKEYNAILENLTHDRSTEYLKDKEVKNKMWYQLCDVWVNRVEYRDAMRLNIRIDQFIEDVCKPLKRYHVVYRVCSLEIENAPIVIGDFGITGFNALELVECGMAESSGRYKELALHFDGATVMRVEEEGTGLDQVFQRATSKARMNINMLRTILTENRFVHDENLLFDLSDRAFIIDTSTNEIVSSRWTRHRDAWGMHLGKDIIESCGPAFAVAEGIEKLPTKIKVAALRAINWIGNAIREEELDLKVIYLCSALECLLTTRDDRMKGERIAYRMVLLSAVQKEHFLNPSKILWIYKLRSKVIHGSDMFLMTKSHYNTMLLAARWTLFGFVKLAQSAAVANLSNLFDILRSSEEASELVTWLDQSHDPEARDISSALRDDMHPTTE